MRDLQQKCLDRADEVYKIAESQFHRNFARIPINFSNKLTKTGGYFQWNRAFGTPIQIKLSNSILRLNPEQFVADVVGHEVAHHIVHCVYGQDEQAHGRRWKQVMTMFKQTANRCHSMQTDNANKFTYKIAGKTIQVGKVRHNRIQSGTASYTLRGAGTLLPSHWVQGERNRTLLPNIIPKQATPRHTRPHTVMPKPKGSKADTVRAMIRDFKAKDLTLDRLLSNEAIVRRFAGEANLKPALFKTYLKNNWAKV